MGTEIVLNQLIINGVTIFNFYVEMLLAVSVVTTSLKHAKWYWLRVAATLLFSAAIWFLLTFILPSFHLAYDYLRYFLLFLTCLAGIYVCYDVSLGSTLFCGAAAYAIQHLICRAYILLFYLHGSLFGTGSWTDIPHFVVYWLILAVMYFALHRLLGHHMRISRVEFSTRGQIVTVITLLVVTIFISATYDISDDNVVNNAIFLFCDGLCATLLLIIQLRAYGLSQKELEMAAAESLHRMELRQMQQTKEMMDLINIKSHDLKHQLIATGGKLNEAEATEIEKAVYAYDGSVNTGLEALDLVVVQKKMVCEREGILLTCMLDGALLTFMSDVHIYSLVGNILDNAIEAVKKLPGDRRYIVFEVKETAGMVLIRTENEYEGELRWKDGMLQTSKADENYHGFGMKSVAVIVEHYGGSMNISAQDDQFVLTVTFVKRTPA